MENETVTFSLRISPELNERILAEAEKQKRSRQAQIEITLEKVFETPNTNGKKEKK